MKNKILLDDMGGALVLTKDVLSNVPYYKEANTASPSPCLMFTLLGYFLDVEVRTAKRRIDIVIQLSDRIYILELKLHEDADAALKQIDLRRYDDRFAVYRREVMKVGISFDVNEHIIREWRIQQE